ncbi:hypothetical protein U91I_03106 [alpha proteobacterium U9-1i]|nr:hypothetical protein U91I_03106 [alpha proteobacterium U9-1i]
MCVLGLSGCITAPDSAPPAWFTEANNADDRGYPSLNDVPTRRQANTDAAYWVRHQRELVAVGAAVKANPRSVWTPVEDPAVFMAEARATLEATRTSHE